MNIPRLISEIITVDFETRPITSHRPPPLPVGCAIRWPDGRCEYLAWGHRTGNNCTKAVGHSKLREIFSGTAPLLFHNAKFDIGVFMHRIGEVPMPHWRRLHDTQFLLIMANPYVKSVHLKDAADRLLGMPPEERDELADWILVNESAAVEKFRVENEISREQAAKALVWLGPVDLVTKYAIGDVVRTFGLFELLFKKLVEDENVKAYELECHTLPHLTALELRGMQTDKLRLEEMQAKLVQSRQIAAIRIYDKLNMFTDIGSTSLARVLAKGDHVTGLGKTAKGNVSTSKDSLNGAVFKDSELRELILYWRGSSYIESNSFSPWLNTMHSDGKIYTSWFQTRGQSEDDQGGAKTLRLSCAWFMNIAKARKLKYDLLPGLVKLPSPREFLIPYPGYEKIICRDWSQQEFRIAAHFEDGALMRKYQSNPYLEVHGDNTAILKSKGFSYPRDVVKVFDLAILYCMGLAKTAAKAGVTENEAKIIRQVIRGSMPELMDLANAMQEVCSYRGYVRTWMGARLPKEASVTMVDGTVRDFGYKIANHAIQRSAAEQMKRTVVEWHEGGYAEKWPWLISIHDENNICSTGENVAEGARELDRVMRGGAWDVPMVSDLAIGPTLGNLIDIKDRDTEFNAGPFTETY